MSNSQTNYPVAEGGAVLGSVPMVLDSNGVPQPISATNPLPVSGGGGGGGGSGFSDLLFTDDTGANFVYRDGGSGAFLPILVPAGTAYTVGANPRPYATFTGNAISGAIMPSGGKGVEGWLSAIAVNTSTGGTGGGAEDLLYTDDSGTQFVYRDTGTGATPVFAAFTIPGALPYVVGANPRPYAVRSVIVTSSALPTGAATDGTAITGSVMPAGGSSINGWLSAIYTKLIGTVAVTGTFFQATQPISNVNDGSDITGAAMPAGGVGFRGWLSAIYTKLSGSIAVTGAFYQATQPVSAASLPLPTGAATDGTAITGSVMPAGGASINGWLSAIYTKLIGSIAVTGTFFQATQPISNTNDGTAITGSAMPAGGAGFLGWLSAIHTKLAGSIAVTGTFFQATQPISATSLPLPTGASTDGAAITGATMPAGGSSINGWLSAIYASLLSPLSPTKTVSTLLSAVVVNQTSAVFVAKGARRTIQTTITGSGAVSAVVTWYGNTTNSTSQGILLATHTLSGTNADQVGSDIPAEWPFVFVILSGISGTSAAVTCTMAV